ncbi:hypothetical protein K2F_18800 [Enterococcus thailandicus]|nr:hypothetical protein K2F_18800 [Enterococcus thailandicus]
MEMTFRWYGSQEEKITLEEIRQIPAMKGDCGNTYGYPRWRSVAERTNQITERRN